ncbi:CLUMA_CG016048, isoform A [Clunio marinus]|uniref:CLUMA_CG016048, isoform A n=1 Tax=Clunio marinus TaxID=568069 RepID=A0A1J1IT05_9DIPT|nr:CLUMA_CG016048, isoform A [Clunio marinus]
MATSLTYEMPHLEVEEFPRVETVITTVTEVIREELPKIDTVATVELQRRDKFRGSEFCLQFWLALETFFWLSLFIVEVRYQFIFMRNDHLLDFINETDGYFYLFFGEELRYADQKVRSK